MIFVIFNIDMNITTSITLVICLGLIVDDTIHILYRRVRLGESLEELGFGILTTSLILTGGFFSFILSTSRPNQVFGLLCAMVFLIAVISDMTIMSWLLSDKEPKAD
jgi:predicted RND superfamily exporter protein